MLHPFYFFQVFSIIVWGFDGYYYYASAIFAISFVSVYSSLRETRAVRPPAPRGRLWLPLGGSPPRLPTAASGRTTSPARIRMTRAPPSQNLRNLRHMARYSCAVQVLDATGDCKPAAGSERAQTFVGLTSRGSVAATDTAATQGRRAIQWTLCRAMCFGCHWTRTRAFRATASSSVAAVSSTRRC